MTCDEWFMELYSEGYCFCLLIAKFDYTLEATKMTTSVL
jgi:hypothetical protein